VSIPAVIYITPIGYLCTCGDVIHDRPGRRNTITGAEASRQAHLHAEHYHQFLGETVTIIDYRTQPSKDEVKQALEFAWDAGAEDVAYHEGYKPNRPQPKKQTTDRLLINIWNEE
jgi:hypothetical protein